MSKKAKIILIAIAALLLAFVIGILAWYFTYGKHTVTFDLDGGSMAVSTATVRYGRPYSLPFPSKDGVVFAGWYYGEERIEAAGASWPYDFNVKLKATWVIRDDNGYVFDETEEGLIISDYRGGVKQLMVAPITHNGKQIVGIKNGAFTRLASADTNVELLLLPVGSSYTAAELGLSEKTRVFEYNFADEEGFYYLDNGAYLSVVGYDGEFVEKILVPSQYKDKPVLAIGEGVFYGAGNKIDQESTSFFRIILPEALSKIGKDAFGDCNGIKVSVYYEMEDGGWREIIDVSRVYNWIQKATIDVGNDQLVDVIGQIRAAFGWSIYTSATFYVRLNADGGIVSETGTDIHEMKIKRNSSYELPTPVREGYTFEGWYYGDTLISQSGSWGYIKHMELTAKWIEN